MIAQLRGEVIQKLSDRIVLDVGGVGYEVLMSEFDREQLSVQADVRIFTYFHVRETAQELFGFCQESAKHLFQQLISVNGVGPKGALAIMGLGDDRQIKSAIASGNIAFLTAASGIGKKAAEKVILDLKDKVGVIAGQFVHDMAVSGQEDEALEALVALGYTAAQATQALLQVDSAASTQDRVRSSLRELSS